MPSANLWGQLHQGVAAGVMMGGYPFAKNVWFVGDHLPIFANRRTASIASAIAGLESGDVVYLGNQRYTEGNLVIPASISDITFIGMSNRGSSYIQPSVSGYEGLQVLADGVTLINVGVASGATGDYSLKVGSQTVSPGRFRAYGCKFEGNESVNPAAQVLLQGAGDVILDDCEIAWGVNGIVGSANNDGYPTEIMIKNCLLHDLVTVGVGIKVGDHFAGIWMIDNVFALDESGVAPTDFVLLSDNANIGFMSGNRFASATNATGTITIGTGIKYNPNGTEAGWSTARPA